MPGLLLQAAFDQSADGRRQRCRQRIPLGITGQHAREGVRQRVCLVDGLTAEHLHQHDAEGPDVGAAIGGLAASLFGAHVGRRAQQRSGARHGRRDRGRVRQAGRAIRVRRVALERLGEAEVEQLELAVLRQHDVGRLEIAMDDAAVVGRLEPLCHLQRQLQRLLERDRSLCEPGGEILPSDQFHDQGVVLALVLQAVDAGDVRVVEGCQHLGLALEPRHALGIAGKLRRQDLDRDVPIQPRVPRAVDLPHAALAEGRGDLEVADGLADHAAIIRPPHPGCGENHRRPVARRI